MSGPHSSVTRRAFFGSEQRYRLFTAVKYSVYLALTFNVFLFLREELQALEHTFVDGFELGQFIQVFSATIDTAAWVILLILFELETSVIDDSRLRGLLKWTLHGIRGLCYLVIVYAFTGYFAELQMLYQVSPIDVAEACGLLNNEYSLLLTLDEFEPLDAANCVGLGAEAVRLTGFNIVAGQDVLDSARWLAWADVINSADWILVCVVLEIEVRLQYMGRLSDQVMAFSRLVKMALYGILFAAALYWGVAGDFLDFWDAALWLFAFIFIELNVFEWQHETSNPVPAPA